METDTFGWSPDIGAFVRRDGITYTEHGAVFEKGALFRSMPSNGTGENYADWSEEKRSEVLVAAKTKAKKAEDERKNEVRAKAVLIASARTKISVEEYNAIVEYGVAGGRGYDFEGYVPECPFDEDMASSVECEKETGYEID